jgi:hypothetical protein
VRPFEKPSNPDAPLVVFPLGWKMTIAHNTQGEGAYAVLQRGVKVVSFDTLGWAARGIFNADDNITALLKALEGAGIVMTEQ